MIEEQDDFLSFKSEIKKAQNLKENEKIMTKAINAKKKELNIKSDQELIENLPDQNAKKHGKVALVRFDGISLTENGKMTLTKYFDRISAARENIYGEMTFTPEEAHSLAMSYSTLSTGINSVVPLKCLGPECTFADSCVYQKMNKAPIGLGCLLEFDLLNYHSQKFIEEFDIDPESHSEMILVQELSELLIYEMRLSRILGEAENARLMTLEVTFGKDGSETQTEKEHWAWSLKEKMKNRKMKILDALMGTRKSKNNSQPIAGDIIPYQLKLNQLMDKIEKLKNMENAQILDEANNEQNPTT